MFFKAADLKAFFYCRKLNENGLALLALLVHFHLFTLRQIPRSCFRDQHVRLERRTRLSDFSWCLHWLILWFLGSERLERNVILRKDLIGQRENKLFLKHIDIIKDFTKDYVTAAKIAQLFCLSHLYQFPCLMNSSRERSICNPEGKE